MNGREQPSFYCQGVNKSFGGVCALSNINIVFPTSGSVAIIGPNGAGKTTLINVLTGFLKPDSGRWFDGEKELTRLPPYRIARLGISRTFQELRLIRQVTVLENVLLARPCQQDENLIGAIFRIGLAAEKRQHNKAAMHTLSFCGIEEKAQDLAGELSYGQQKLLTLACCLAMEPRIVLFDEPVSGVHPGLVDKILQLIKQLKKLGMLIIFIEHDLRAVRDVADKVIVMDDGKIIAQGIPDEVLDRPDVMEAYIA